MLFCTDASVDVSWHGYASMVAAGGLSIDQGRSISFLSLLCSNLCHLLLCTSIVKISAGAVAMLCTSSIFFLAHIALLFCGTNINSSVHLRA